MSVSLQQQQQAKAITELELRPEVRARLDACLSTYADIYMEVQILEEQLGIERSKIGKLLADQGYDKVKTDEFSLWWTRGADNPRLDKQKLLAQGVTLAQIQAATTHTPKKDFFQIKGKNEKSEAE